MFVRTSVVGRFYPFSPSNRSRAVQNGNHCADDHNLNILLLLSPEIVLNKKYRVFIYFYCDSRLITTTMINNNNNTCDNNAKYDNDDCDGLRLGTSPRAVVPICPRAVAAWNRACRYHTRGEPTRRRPGWRTFSPAFPVRTLLEKRTYSCTCK